MCLRDGSPRLHLRLKNPVPGVSLLRSRKRKLLSSLGFSAENGRSLALSFPSPSPPQHSSRAIQSMRCFSIGINDRPSLRYDGANRLCICIFLRC